ncbi:suppressor of fused domain protein, partial [Frankia sp. R82]|uniref:suppressor of fused domain protein n=1 Tax=Frankia sp. R82 TaxID=2950553 RepID=UPI0020446907
TGAAPTGAAPTGAAPTGAAPTGAAPTGAAPTGAAPTGAAPVRFLPLLPMTTNEAAYKRVHGPEALHQRWLAAGTDLRDPNRSEVPLS